MITGNCFVVLICVLFSFNVIDGLRTCSNQVNGCKCYNTGTTDPNEVAQVRCENAIELDDANLDILGVGLTGDWDVLYIHNTKLTKINADTFSYASFKKIFIENNSQLTSIAADAFVPSDKTETLQIRNNHILADENIFKIAKIFEKSLKNIWFDNNKIAKIPNGAFVGEEGLNDIFQNLEVIGIDSQKEGVLKEIPANFISNLPKLNQVSLSENAIQTIEAGAFNLEKSKPTSPALPHVSIFLNKNPGLLQTQITDKQIKIPVDTGTSVRLVLEETGINELSADFVALLSSIAKKADGRVYLKDTKITKCVCATAGPIRADNVKKNIHGIDETIVCDSTKKLSECPAT